MTLTITRNWPSFELKVFQSESAKTIVDRYAFLRAIALSRCAVSVGLFLGANYMALVKETDNGKMKRKL
jgi:hypothetical protein